MVLTFDDLPYQAAGYPDTLERAQRATEAIVGTLANHGAPSLGLVNGSKLFANGDSEARIGLLKRWLANGGALGNHTFSHPDLNRLSAEEFERDIVRGEQVIFELMANRQPYQRYFRHPYTHTGDTKEKKARIAAFLEARGYAVAPYTIDSQDYTFNRVYLDAKGLDDQELANRVQDSYINFVIAATEFAERKSLELFDEEIPQTLLLHANDINADAIGKLLDRLTGRGYRFIALDEAMEHRAYQTEDKLVTRFGPSWLWRWNKSLGLDRSFDGDPEPPAWIQRLLSE